MAVLRTMMLVECTYPGMIEGKDGNNIIYKNGDQFYIDPMYIKFSGRYDCYILCDMFSLEGRYLGVTDANNFRTIKYHHCVGAEYVHKEGEDELHDV